MILWASTASTIFRPQWGIRTRWPRLAMLATCFATWRLWWLSSETILVGWFMISSISVFIYTIRICDYILSWGLYTIRIYLSILSVYEYNGWLYTGECDIPLFEHPDKPTDDFWTQLFWWKSAWRFWDPQKPDHRWSCHCIGSQTYPKASPIDPTFRIATVIWCTIWLWHCQFAMERCTMLLINR